MSEEPKNSITIGGSVDKSVVTAGTSGNIVNSSTTTDVNKQPIDLSKLVEELFTLRQAMKKEALEAEQDIAVGEVGKAEQATKAGDVAKATEHLKIAGQWALEIATKIGVPLAIEALKKAMAIG